MKKSQKVEIKAKNKKTNKIDMKTKEIKPKLYKNIKKSSTEKKSSTLSKQQQEIVDLKSQLMIEKMKNISPDRDNFAARKRKRKFRDTQYDKNATTASILKGAALMVFAFGMLCLFLLIAL